MVEKGDTLIKIGKLLGVPYQAMKKILMEGVEEGTF